MHKRAIIFLVLFALLIAAIPAYHFLILPNLPNRIDWTMYGIVVDSAGNQYNYVQYFLDEFTVTGTIDDIDFNRAELKLRIVLPETFQYRFETEQDPDRFTEYPSYNRAYTGESYYVIHSYSYDRRENQSVMTAIGLCREKEYMIFNWDDGKDLYLVASTDPDTTPTEILEYFLQFREIYQIDD